MRQTSSQGHCAGFHSIVVIGIVGFDPRGYLTLHSYTLEIILTNPNHPQCYGTQHNDLDC